jgi:hypothetical protein
VTVPQAAIASSRFSGVAIKRARHFKRPIDALHEALSIGECPCVVGYQFF